MEKYSKESGKMEKLMAMELDYIVMEINILEVMLIISEMDKDIIFLLMVIAIMEIGLMGRQMDLGLLSLEMEIYMKESLKIT